MTDINKCTYTDLTPRSIVAELDKDIVGQGKAKRAVAIALRNRIRRQLLDGPMAADINPKNIILIGATGVGKTEIARRLAKLMKAPFVKVEATKFTEVGYMGRDVESVIRDLTHNGISRVKKEKGALFAEEASRKAEERILDSLMVSEKTAASPDMSGIFSTVTGSFDLSTGVDEEGNVITLPLDDSPERKDYCSGIASDTSFTEMREQLRKELRDGSLDDREVAVTVQDSGAPAMDMVALGPGSEEMEIQFRNVLKGILPSRSRNKTFKVSEARQLLVKEETENLLDMEKIVKEGIERVEQRGIVFLDELDKVAMPTERKGSGPDVSREGVQRDLLPVVEGTTVITKYGPVKTDHILFIAAGAFHMSKPSDLIPELQGRFPIRVELEDLGIDELRRILVEPRSSLVKQYQHLLNVDGLELVFTDESIDSIARMAHKVNHESENLGARRLHTVLEKMLEELLFNAPDALDSPRFEVTSAFVEEKLSDLVNDRDLSRFIL